MFWRKKRPANEDKEESVRKDIERRVYEAIDIIGKAVGAKIKRSEYPHVGAGGGGSSYVPALNFLVVGIYDGQSEEDLRESIGEEVSHYIRAKILKQLPPEPSSSQRKTFKDNQDSVALNKFLNAQNFKNNYTQEFFGFLGRKILNQHYHGHAANNPWEHYQTHLEGLRDARKKNRIINKIRKKSRDEVDTGKKEHAVHFKEMNEWDDYQDDLAQGRKTRLIHMRPYNFASQLDIQSVDLAKLYHLPDSEVRKKFFRSDPILGGLERAAAAAGILTLTLGSAISWQLTGNAIGTHSSPLLGVLISGLSCIVLAGVFHYLKRRKISSLLSSITLQS